MSARFMLQIGRPRFGWLPLSITIGDVTVEDEASGVLNDPLAEIADVAVAMGRNDGLSERVSIWLEPEWLDLQFEATAGAETVEIALHDRGGRRRVAGTRVPRALARDELLHGLWHLAAEMPRDGRTDGWTAFPWPQLRAASGENVDVHVLGLRPPWRPFRGGGRHGEELQRELRPGHPLHGLAATFVAINDDTDEYLVAIATGVEAWATVLLTWEGAPSRDRALPRTTLYRSLREWRLAHLR